jgi:hypothetical protein
MGVGHTFLETLPLYEDGPGNGKWNLGPRVQRRRPHRPRRCSVKCASAEKSGRPRHAGKGTSAMNAGPKELNEAFVRSLPDNGPVVMVNLLRFKKRLLLPGCDG